MILIGNFQYGEEASYRFGLVTGSIGGEGSSGVYTVGAYSNVEISTDRARNRASPFYYESKLIDHLEFPMTIINKHGEFYESWEVQIIENWLFGRQKPQILTIHDPDKMNESYECWLVNPELIKVENKIVGWSFIVKCTSAYSISGVKTTIIKCPTVNTEYNYWNHSNVEQYLFPEMIIKLASDTSYIRIENKSDKNRVFQLSGLRNGEEIFINNDLGYLDTKSGDKILKNFNLNFFRVVEGLNQLTINGKCTITLNMRLMRGVGGF